MIYGSPHIETKLSLIIDIISLFIISLFIAIIAISVSKKWSKISLLNVIISNSFLYGTQILLYITSFSLYFYIGSFSAKNDLTEKILYSLFFALFFLLQCFIFFKLFSKKDNERFVKRLHYLLVACYLFSVVYIVIKYFPSDAYDKYLVYTKTYLYLPTEKTKTLLDNSKLEIDSAVSDIDYFSDKQNSEDDEMFTIYFNSNHKETPPFSFKALDSTNQFGGSSEQIKYKELYLKKLKDSIKIIIEEVKFDQNIGWDNPKNTDTILFIKTKTRIDYNH